MLTSEQVAEAFVQVQSDMAKQAKKVNGSIEFTMTLPDGGIFIIKYRLPKKGGK